jgi:hypothetical protein
VNIRSILLEEHSRNVTNTILEAVKNDHSLIKELMDCFFDANLRVCQRAAWPVGDLGEKYPQLILPYLDKMITQLKNPKHNAIIRNTVRTWQFMSIPDKSQGEVYEVCFHYIIDPKVPIAIRAFSMTVCANICKNYPELKAELMIAIQDQMENGSAGICSRGRKIINSLSNDILP